MPIRTQDGRSNMATEKTFMSVLITKHYSGDKILIRWAGHVGRVGEKRGVYRVLVARP